MQADRQSDIVRETVLRNMSMKPYVGGSAYTNAVKKIANRLSLLANRPKYFLLIFKKSA